MKLKDALFNWLQMRIVADGRPDDRAARDTLEFFADILRQDHGLTDFHISATDETFVTVKYVSEGKVKTQLFDRQSAEQLLRDIESNPKYNE